VCLQPYERAEYADKMSAVTFDALRAGSPIVTVAGTSMARIVEESGAGIVIEAPTAERLAQAAQEVIGDYASYRARALTAGERYRLASSWAPMVERLRAAVSAAKS
jgi:UDP:flavonoid glycosyltransferase YjiC (YdhE family)